MESNSTRTFRVVALVPMRHTSERIPGKNYRPLAGKPLYEYILKALQLCSNIARIVVDTDSPDIKAGIKASYKEVEIIDRPEHLRAGDIPMNDIIAYDLSQIEGDFFLQTHSTNPLLEASTIRSAIEVFANSQTQFDSLFSVTKHQTRFWSQEGEPINHNPQELHRTQDLPPLYEENSCLYIFSRQSFNSTENRIGTRPQLYEIDPIEAIDIDEAAQLKLVEKILLSRHQESHEEA